MQSYLSTYIGPAILAEYSIGYKPTKIRKCVNEKCQRKKPIIDGAKYCPQCGELVNSVNGPEEDVIIPSFEDIENAFIKAGISIDNISEERFSDVPEDFHLYLPNCLDDLKSKFYQEEPKSLYVEIDEIDIESEKKWLLEKYASEIEILKSLYKSVVVKWVFINSMS